MKTLSNLVPPPLKGEGDRGRGLNLTPMPKGGDAETKTLSNFVPPPLKGEGDRGRGCRVKMPVAETGGSVV